MLENYIDVAKFALALLGQLSVLLGVVWRLISTRFKELESNFDARTDALEKTFEEKLRVTKALGEADLTNVVIQFRDMREDVDRRYTAFAESIKNCVTISVCETRKEYETRMFNMLEKSLENISNKLDFVNNTLLKK